ncbi:hypothetical protein ACK389_21465 [Streptomyces antibioticus]|uniref:hypothetical protein n=1 Tax=Streptomyces TaxID=1883 RepID=UPI0029AD47B7|nr:hypothetical protein [Streptomyces europaeiscabiei]MDX3777503.1 hypothetical protein [Streptomyces europaeiscabiei]
MEITLQQAVSDLRRVLEIIRDVAREVYATNADRHDPSHGDDNGTFAQLVWRNIANLSFQKLHQAGIPVRKVAGGAIEVISQPWVLRVYKFPLTAPGKVRDKLEQLSWDGSAARLRGAVQNSAAQGQMAFDQDPDWADSFAEAVRQGHVRIVHTGDPETGNCVIEVGLPRDNREGGSPWLDGTIEIHNDLQSGLPAPRSAVSELVVHGELPEGSLSDQDHELASDVDPDENRTAEEEAPKAPDHTDLKENDLPLRRRTEETREERENTD